MLSSQQTTPRAPRAPLNVSHEEVAQFVEGIATRAQSRRVLLSALTNSTVRRQIQTLRVAETEAEMSTGIPDAAFEACVLRLRSSLQKIAREAAVAAPASPTGETLLDRTERVLVRVAAHVARRFADAGRALEMPRHPLTLPGFAPALAAPALDLKVHRQTVQTAEGVRIEFQQFPGSLSKLRLLVDTSAILPIALLQTADAHGLYKAAFVTLEERRDNREADRHILIVPLQHDGRGFMDFTLRAGDTNEENALPTPRGGCQLVGVTLSQSADWQNTL